MVRSSQRALQEMDTDNRVHAAQARATGVLWEHRPAEEQAEGKQGGHVGGGNDLEWTDILLCTTEGSVRWQSGRGRGLGPFIISIKFYLVSLIPECEI